MEPSEAPEAISRIARDVGASIRFLDDREVWRRRGKTATDLTIGPCPMIMQPRTALRSRTRSEHYGIPGLRIRRDASDEPRAEKIMRHLARLQAREAAVAGWEDERTPYPAWSFNMSHVVVHLVLAMGGDPTEYALPWRWQCTERGMTADEIWNRACGNRSVQGSDALLPHVNQRPHVELSGDRVIMRQMTIARDRSLAIREDWRSLCITTAATLPDTIMRALPGRDLAEVISSPLFEGIGPLPILGASHDKGLSLLRIANTRVPVARPPSGIDVHWP